MQCGCIEIYKQISAHKSVNKLSLICKVEYDTAAFEQTDVAKV